MEHSAKKRVTKLSSSPQPVDLVISTQQLSKDLTGKFTFHFRIKTRGRKKFNGMNEQKNFFP
jgi:hypothetical protein